MAEAMPTPIEGHEGRKYLRIVWSAGGGVACDPKLDRVGVQADVYAVLDAFGVTCPARQHAIKKLLCAGLRGKGSGRDDLVGALAAVGRAIELQDVRDRSDLPARPDCGGDGAVPEDCRSVARCGPCDPAAEATPAGRRAG